MSLEAQTFAQLFGYAAAAVQTYVPVPHGSAQRWGCEVEVLCFRAAACCLRTNYLLPNFFSSSSKQHALVKPEITHFSRKCEEEEEVHSSFTPFLFFHLETSSVLA